MNIVHWSSSSIWGHNENLARLQVHMATCKLKHNYTTTQNSFQSLNCSSIQHSGTEWNYDENIGSKSRQTDLNLQTINKNKSNEIFIIYCTHPHADGKSAEVTLSTKLFLESNSWNVWRLVGYVKTSKIWQRDRAPYTMCGVMDVSQDLKFTRQNLTWTFF